MDRLSFCRENLNKLTDEELLEVYNLLCFEYSDGEFALENDMKYIETILEVMNDFKLPFEVWSESIANGNYVATDKYIEISMNGIISMNNEDIMIDWVYKKMNGEAISMIEGYLQNRGVKLPKYVIVHDVDNGEFHLHTLGENGNPTSKKVIVGCEDMKELLALSENYGIQKKDIVDYLKIDEIKEYC